MMEPRFLKKCLWKKQEEEREEEMWFFLTLTQPGSQSEASAARCRTERAQLSMQAKGKVLSQVSKGREPVQVGAQFCLHPTHLTHTSTKQQRQTKMLFFLPVSCFLLNQQIQREKQFHKKSTKCCSCTLQLHSTHKQHHSTDEGRCVYLQVLLGS